MKQSYGSGQIFVLVGPGGAGKNTLMKMVLPRVEKLSQLATATTRAPRPDEQAGREHLFVSVDTFNQWKREGKLLEDQEVHPGKFYGVPRAPLEAAFAEGRDLIADIEIAGAEKIYSAYPDNTVLVFIDAPEDVLIKRMRDRGESEQGIRDRMARAKAEKEFPLPYHKTIMNNGDLIAARDELERIIIKAREGRKVEA